MNWIDEVQAKIKRKNQILFTKDTEYLQDLTMLFEDQNHKVMVLWALSLAWESVASLKEAYPEEMRPEEALNSAWDWASGKIKMNQARRKILDCHAFAKEISCKEDIATCHAIGQACGVVHATSHAIGYPVYDLTSIIYKFGIEDCVDAINARKKEYIERLLYWREHFCDYKGKWADFMNK